MNKPAPAPRWFSGWRSAPVRVEQDLADCGTAFGLDLSLSELQVDPVKPGAPKARKGWMQRLAARRRPAT